MSSSMTAAELAEQESKSGNSYYLRTGWVMDPERVPEGMSGLIAHDALEERSSQEILHIRAQLHMWRAKELEFGKSSDGRVWVMYSTVPGVKESQDFDLLIWQAAEAAFGWHWLWQEPVCGRPGRVLANVPGEGSIWIPEREVTRDMQVIQLAGGHTIYCHPRLQPVQSWLQAIAIDGEHLTQQLAQATPRERLIFIKYKCWFGPRIDGGLSYGILDHLFWLNRQGSTDAQLEYFSIQTGLPVAYWQALRDTLPAEELPGTDKTGQGPEFWKHQVSALRDLREKLQDE
jgi:hypothetical protein